MGATSVSAAPPRPQSFLVNVLWNWVAVAANIFASIFVTRYLIRQLGDERYGIWALTFSLIEYVFLFDLGFRSAVVTFVSRRRAEGDKAGIDQIISTALAYFSGVALLVIGLTFTLAPYAWRWFHISERYQADFSFLLTLVGMTWAIGIMASVFQASLEAAQNFRVYSHIMVVVLILRSAGSVLVLHLGFGLKAMGILVVSCQGLGYVLMFLAFLKAYPEVRIKRIFVQASTWRQMAGYGVHSLLTASGTILLYQSPPVMIGIFRSEADVGYYAVPAKLLQYIVDMVARIAYVTVPKTSELMALGQTDKVVKLGVYTNRYSLSLFMPVSIFLTYYGTELVLLWLGPTFARESGPLIPILTCGMTLAVAGQYSSSVILFGMATHQLYAKALFLEAVAILGGMIYVLPRYGILGLAWLAATLMILNRGLITPMIFAYHLKVNYFDYMAKIYVRPLLTAVPVALGVWWLKRGEWVQGRSWLELLAIGGGTALLYLGLCFVTCLEPEHRQLLKRMLQRRLGARDGHEMQS